jgi:hypothetical protein
MESDLAMDSDWNFCWWLRKCEKPKNNIEVDPIIL